MLHKKDIKAINALLDLPPISGRSMKSAMADHRNTIQSQVRSFADVLLGREPSCRPVKLYPLFNNLV